jgi:hypothetical protein
MTVNVTVKSHGSASRQNHAAQHQRQFLPAKDGLPRTDAEAKANDGERERENGVTEFNKGEVVVDLSDHFNLYETKVLLSLCLKKLITAPEALILKGKPRIAGSYRGFNLPFTQKKGKLYEVKLKNTFGKVKYFFRGEKFFKFFSVSSGN